MIINSYMPDDVDSYKLQTRLDDITQQVGSIFIGNESFSDHVNNFAKIAAKLVYALIKLIGSVIELYAIGITEMLKDVVRAFRKIKEKLLHIFKKPPKLVTATLQNVQIENAIDYREFSNLLSGYTKLVRLYNKVADPAIYREQFSALLRLDAKSAAEYMPRSTFKLTEDVIRGIRDDLLSYVGVKVNPIVDQYDGSSVVVKVEIDSSTNPVTDKRNRSGLLSELGYTYDTISTLYNNSYADLNGLYDVCVDYIHKFKKIKEGLASIQLNISKSYNNNQDAITNVSTRCKYLIANITSISTIHARIVAASKQYTSWIDNITEIMYKNVKDVKAA